MRGASNSGRSRSWLRTSNARPCDMVREGQRLTCGSSPLPCRTLDHRARFGANSGIRTQRVEIKVSPVRIAAAAQGGERGLTNGNRRSTKHEKDPLSEPIVRPDGLAVGLIAQAFRDDPATEQAVWDEAMRWVDRQKVEKLLLLLERNGLSLNNPHSWFLLSLQL